MEVDEGVTELVKGMTIEESTKDGIRQIAANFTDLTGDIFDSIRNISIADLVPNDVLQNVTDSLKGLVELGIDPTKVDDGINNIENILSDDVEPHLNDIIKFIEKLDEELMYNKTCDIECVVDQVLSLSDDATNYINTTTRMKINSTTTSSISNITELGNENWY